MKNLHPFLSQLESMKDKLVLVAIWKRLLRLLPVSYNYKFQQNQMLRDFVWLFLKIRSFSDITRKHRRAVDVSLLFIDLILIQ